MVNVKVIIMKDQGLWSPNFPKISAPLSKSSPMVLGSFVGGVEAFSLLNLLL